MKKQFISLLCFLSFGHTIVAAIPTKIVNNTYGKTLFSIIVNEGNKSSEIPVTLLYQKTWELPSDGKRLVSITWADSVTKKIYTAKDPLAHISAGGTVIIFKDGKLLLDNKKNDMKYAKAE